MERIGTISAAMARELRGGNVVSSTKELIANDVIIYSMIIMISIAMLFVLGSCMKTRCCNSRDKVKPMSPDDVTEMESVSLNRVHRRDFILKHIILKKPKRRASAMPISFGKSPVRPSYFLDLDDEEVNTCTPGRDDKTMSANSMSVAYTHKLSPESPGDSKMEGRGFMRKSLDMLTGFLKPDGSDQQYTDCCGICLCTFDERDGVCTSPNRSCPHKFHVDCIIEWLMDTDKCPCCGIDYLGITNKPIESVEVKRGDPSVRSGLSTFVAHSQFLDAQGNFYDSDDGTELVIQTTSRTRDTRKSLVDVGI